MHISISKYQPNVHFYIKVPTKWTFIYQSTNQPYISISKYQPNEHFYIEVPTKRTFLYQSTNQTYISISKYQPNEHFYTKVPTKRTQRTDSLTTRQSSVKCLLDTHKDSALFPEPWGSPACPNDSRVNNIKYGALDDSADSGNPQYPSQCHCLHQASCMDRPGIERSVSPTSNCMFFKLWRPTCFGKGARLRPYVHLARGTCVQHTLAALSRSVGHKTQPTSVSVDVFP
jgi:hypothetical protein